MKHVLPGQGLGAAFSAKFDLLCKSSLLIFVINTLSFKITFWRKFKINCTMGTKAIHSYNLKCWIFLAHKALKLILLTYKYCTNMEDTIPDM